MIEGLGGRLPPAAAKAVAGPVVAPVKVKAAEAGTSPLARAATGIAAEPPVDSTKVDRIRSAIAVGSYKIDPQAIAERMIATDLDRG